MHQQYSDNPMLTDYRQTYRPRPLLNLPRWAWNLWHWL
jgi:hypothetical protein